MGHRCTRNRGLPNLPGPDQPPGHVAAVAPPGDGNVGFIHDATLLQHLDSRKYVPTGSVTGIFHNCAAVVVAEIITSAIIGLKNQPSLGGDQLYEYRESILRGRSGSAVNIEHQRQLLSGCIVRWIGPYPVFGPILWGFFWA